jgi:hypothetical protein
MGRQMRSMIRNLLVGAIGFASCGGNNTGAGGASSLPANASAEQLATALCQWNARCGKTRITCRGSGMGGGGATDAMTRDCVGSIVPVAFEDCYSDTYPEVKAELDCASLTADERALLESCVRTWIGRDCPDQAALDQAALIIESGGIRPAFLDPPSVCHDHAVALAGRCGIPPQLLIRDPAARESAAQW